MDGPRRQVSWLTGPWTGAPSRFPSGVWRRSSPFTVAGAAAVLAPDGYTSPRSLLIPVTVRSWGTTDVTMLQLPVRPVNRELSTECLWSCGLIRFLLGCGIFDTGSWADGPLAAALRPCARSSGADGHGASSDQRARTCGDARYGAGGVEGPSEHRADESTPGRRRLVRRGETSSPGMTLAQDGRRTDLFPGVCYVYELFEKLRKTVLGTKKRGAEFGPRRSTQSWRHAL